MPAIPLPAAASNAARSQSAVKDAASLFSTFIDVLTGTPPSPHRSRVRVTAAHHAFAPRRSAARAPAAHHVIAKSITHPLEHRHAAPVAVSHAPPFHKRVARVAVAARTGHARQPAWVVFGKKDVPLWWRAEPVLRHTRQRWLLVGKTDIPVWRRAVPIHWKRKKTAVAAQGPNTGLIQY